MSSDLRDSPYMVNCHPKEGVTQPYWVVENSSQGKKYTNFDKQRDQNDPEDKWDLGF